MRSLVDAGGHGPTTPWFGCAVCGPGKEVAGGAFKIDVAMMQSQGPQQDKEEAR